MKIISKIIILIVLLPMWMVFYLLDIIYERNVVEDFFRE